MRDLAIDAPVQPPHQFLNRDLKDLANTQQRRYRNWPSSLDLLPVTGRKSV